MISLIVVERGVLYPRSRSITFHRLDGTETPVFTLRVAATPDEWKQGLMHVRALPEREGMLFAFPDEQVRSFWMKETYLPLDIIFLDGRGEVVEVIPSATPNSTELHTAHKKSRYVVELEGGTAAKFKIRKGTHIKVQK